MLDHVGALYFERNLRSPLVGTYYAAPSPDAPPFVSVGDVVEHGQTVAIVEAMKMMNPVVAEQAGVVVEILVTTNGGPGSESTTLTFLVYKEAILDSDVGTAAAGGVVAVILANIVAIFLMRAIGKNLDA